MITTVYIVLKQSYPYQLPYNGGDSLKGQIQSTGTNQEQKKHGSADQSFDISNGEESWDNRISKVLKSQKKHLCENHNCQINNVGFMSKEELTEHTMRMHCCIKP